MCARADRHAADGRRPRPRGRCRRVGTGTPDRIRARVGDGRDLLSGGVVVHGWSTSLASSRSCVGFRHRVAVETGLMPGPRTRDRRGTVHGARAMVDRTHSSEGTAMPTIAIIGAGPGLGAAVARRFGAEGFSIALISRDQAKLDELAAQLQDGGAIARGYAADVLNPASLEVALARAVAELGPIAVLQYSPLPSREYLKPVLEMTPELALEALRFSALGLIHAVRSVLPAMRTAGDGSIILINGGASRHTRSRGRGDPRRSARDPRRNPEAPTRERYRRRGRAHLGTPRFPGPVPDDAHPVGGGPRVGRGYRHRTFMRERPGAAWLSSAPDRRFESLWGRRGPGCWGEVPVIGDHVVSARCASILG
jgi:NAD(P)-dependent dehydrogenase (short-subunit alcohol dehydrogenase family)